MQFNYHVSCYNIHEREIFMLKEKLFWRSQSFSWCNFINYEDHEEGSGRKAQEEATDPGRTYSSQNTDPEIISFIIYDWH